MSKRVGLGGISSNAVYRYPWRPRTIEEKVQGTTVRRAYHDYQFSGTPGAEIWTTEQGAGPSCNYGNSANLRTVTEYYDARWDITGNGGMIPPRVKSIRYPDGRKDVYLADPTTGNYDPLHSTPPVTGLFSPGIAETGTPGSFVTPAAGQTDERYYIVHGYVDGNGDFVPGIDGKTTIEVIVENQTRQPLYRGVYVYPGITSARLIEWTEWDYDARGRLTGSFSSNGAHASTVWQDCCRQQSTVDETGVGTTYLYDSLGRTQSVTKAGIGTIPELVTSYTRDGLGASGHRASTTIGTGTPSLSSRVEYDTAGRIAKSVDQAGLETTYTYDVAPPVNGSGGGGKRVTVVHPGNATEITDYYRDGRIKSITGTAVVNKYYYYWVDSSTGNRWTREMTGSDDPAVTPFVTDTETNWLNQTVTTIEQYDTTSGHAVTTTFTYNNKGQLVRTHKATATGPLVADTVYEYDEMGDLFRSGLDLDATPGLTLGSTDRITETETKYINDSTDWWQVTMNRVYANNNDDTPTPPVSETWRNTQRRRLTGWANNLTEEQVSVDLGGNATTARVFIDRANKTVTRTVAYPDTATAETTVTVNGLLQEVTSKTGLTTSYGYDPLGRQITTTDPRTGTATTDYAADTGQVDWTRDAAQNTTSYTYCSQSEAGAGRIKSVTGPPVDGYPNGAKQYFSYTLRGEQEHTWGDTVYPVEYGYDSFGRQALIRTYRGGTGWTGATWPGGDADTTVFLYTEQVGQTQVPTRWLAGKRYADGTPDASTVSYTHTPDGRLRTRTWARGVTTTYAYWGEGQDEANTGELHTVTYSGGNTPTPTVTYGYNRMGKADTVGEAGVTSRAFAYDAATFQPTTETITGLYSKLITRKYEGSTDPVPHRPNGFQIGVSGTPAQDYDTTYQYDGYGRLSDVVGPGLDPSDGVHYDRLSDSELIAFISYDDWLVFSERGYPPGRNLLRSASTYVNDDVIFWLSEYLYPLDALGRRTAMIATAGLAFDEGSGDHHWDYAYNGRSELTGGDRRAGPYLQQGAYLPPGDFDYAYDNIGNRGSSNVDNANPATTYTTNHVNQYTATANPSVSFTYDADGNMTTDGNLTYDWDGENRLAAAYPTNPGTGAVKVTFAYDYLSRRVRKQVFGRSGNDWSSTPSTDLRFVYDGWNVVLVLDVYNATLTKYTWGLDLSGQAGNGSVSGIHGAGGIGGLLACEVPQGTSVSKKYWFFYDGNGNVGQVLDATDPYNLSLPAHYEYDPYGNALVVADVDESGFADDNPFRFSTKWLDAETGLYCYGYRYYDSHWGRWTSHDPIGEADGPNLYAYIRNNAVDLVDPDGSAAYSATGNGKTLPPRFSPEWRERCEKRYSFPPEGKDPASCEGLPVPEQCPEILRRTAHNARVVYARMGRNLFCYADWAFGTPEEQVKYWNHVGKAFEVTKPLIKCVNKARQCMCCNSPPSAPPPVPVVNPNPGIQPSVGPEVVVGAAGACILKQAATVGAVGSGGAGTGGGIIFTIGTRAAAACNFLLIGPRCAYESLLPPQPGVFY